ncbi:Armadillo-type fold [Lactarius tabidus]
MRLAASGYLRDMVKLEQLDDDALKLHLVPAMIAHSGVSDKAIRAQIAESVSLITELDLPERWPDLIDSHFQPDDPTLSLPSRIRTGVIEISEMYLKPYPEIWSPNLSALSPPRSAPALIAISSRPSTRTAGLIAGVVVPNLALRMRDIETFQDTSLEYIPAANAVKVLGGVGPDGESAMTGVALEWIGRALAEASAARDGDDGWKNKDAAAYLFEAVATRSGKLAVDAIQYLYTFRYQLTKEQLASVLLLLLNRLESQEVVVYTYAAVALDRILSMGAGGSTTLMFSDVQPFASQLLVKLGVQNNPERTAENDFLMRFIITALAGEYVTVLQRLIDILRKVPPNPSNPNFDQYIFESISGLIQFIGASVPDSIAVFEPALFPSFAEILQKDIDHADAAPGVPVNYRALLLFLLTPAMLVALLRAFLTRDGRGEPAHVVAGHCAAEAGTEQGERRLGLRAPAERRVTFPSVRAAAVFRQIIMTLLTRMQQNKTNNYVYYFLHFLLYLLAINVDDLTPDYLIQTVDEIQSGLWSQITSNFIVPQISQLVLKDRRVVAVGLTRPLTQSTLSLPEAKVPATRPARRLFRETHTNDGTDTGAMEIDMEEQAAYSKLATTSTLTRDVVAYAGDVCLHVACEFTRLLGAEPSVKTLVELADRSLVGPFFASLGVST